MRSYLRWSPLPSTRFLFHRQAFRWSPQWVAFHLSFVCVRLFLFIYLFVLSDCLYLFACVIFAFLCVFIQFNFRSCLFYVFLLVGFVFMLQALSVSLVCFTNKLSGYQSSRQQCLAVCKFGLRADAALHWPSGQTRWVICFCWLVCHIAGSDPQAFDTQGFDLQVFE